MTGLAVKAILIVEHNSESLDRAVIISSTLAFCVGIIQVCKKILFNNKSFKIIVFSS